MSDEQAKKNLEAMDDLDFVGWNNADWDGVFAHHHTDDVVVDMKGVGQTYRLQEHVDAMKAMMEPMGGTPSQVRSHPIAFGSGTGRAWSASWRTAVAW